jgi:hypothetical protein
MASPVVEGRALPTYAQETRRLRELHESYAWQVNAAIGEGRDDVVRQLCDDFLSQALEIMAAGQTAVPCLQPDCPTCAALGPGSRRAHAPESPFPPQRPAPAAEATPQRFRWLRRLFRP